MRSRRVIVAALVLVGALAALLVAWFLSGWADVRARQQGVREAPIAGANQRGAELARELRDELAGVLEREVARPYFHYQNVFHDPRASASVGVTPSPLAAGPDDPLVRGHFRIDDGGRVTTPTINDDVPSLSEPTNLAGNTAFRNAVARTLAGPLTPHPSGNTLVASVTKPPAVRPHQVHRPAVQTQVVQIDNNSFTQNNEPNFVYQQQRAAPNAPVQQAQRNPADVNPANNPDAQTRQGTNPGNANSTRQAANPGNANSTRQAANPGNANSTRQGANPGNATTTNSTDTPNQGANPGNATTRNSTGTPNPRDAATTNSTRQAPKPGNATTNSTRQAASPGNATTTNSTGTPNQAAATTNSTDTPNQAANPGDAATTNSRRVASSGTNSTDTPNQAANPGNTTANSTRQAANPGNASATNSTTQAANAGNTTTTNATRQAANPGDTTTNSTRQGANPGDASTTNSPGSPANPLVPVVVSAFEWKTLPFEGTPTLVAVRSVQMPDRALAQGFVIDRSTLSSWLASRAGESVAELRNEPHAKATPHSDDEPTAPEMSATEIAPGWHLSVSPNPRAIVDADAEAAHIEHRFVLRFAVVGVLAALAAVFVVLLVARSEALARERSQFAAAAAHELRTPLAGLQLYGDMLADGLGDPAKMRDYARRMSEEASRLGRVVSNVLGFSQLERGNLSVEARVGPLGEALRDLADRARPALDRAGATLELEVTDVDARFDRDALARIVANLLDNAEKYSRGADDRRIDLVASEQGDGIEIAVADRGPGVDIRGRAALFQPFKRGVTADGPAGLGLGLALSQSLARAMDGDLAYRPTPEGGATFVLRLAKV